MGQIKFFFTVQIIKGGGHRQSYLPLRYPPDPHPVLSLSNRATGICPPPLDMPINEEEGQVKFWPDGSTCQSSPWSYINIKFQDSRFNDKHHE